MPEHQASPSCSQPPSAHEDSQQPVEQQDGISSTLEAKRHYLSLLPQSQLIDLLLAIDANRDTTIFPPNVDEAIHGLQPVVPVVVKSEPTTTSIPPLVLSPQATTASPLQPASPVPPPQPPQYNPPAQKLVYPYAPYYHPLQPVPPPPHVEQVSPPTAPVRHPLFTSAPLSRDGSKPTLARQSLPPAPVSSRDDPNAMPSYEEMLVEAIMDVGDQDGTAPKTLFSWMAVHYPLQQNFRPSASQALHKALKRGRLEKIGGKYRLNPSWGGGPTTSKRATRRPTANRALSPSQTHNPPKLPVRAPTALPPPYHTPYGYYAPHPYAGYPPNGAIWLTGQPVQPVALQPQQAAQQPEDVKDEDMEGMEDIESEEDLKGKAVTSLQTKSLLSLDMDEATKEGIKTSLLRLASVLRRFAKKGEGTGE